MYIDNFDVLEIVPRDQLKGNVGVSARRARLRGHRPPLPGGAHHRPAGAGAVLGAHGAGVIQTGRLLIGEIAIAVGRSEEADAVGQEAGGDQAVVLAGIDRIGSDLRAVFRGNGGDAGVVGRRRLIGLLADSRNELLVLGRQARQFLGTADHTRQ